MASRCSRALLLLLVLVSPLWAVEDNTSRGEIGISQASEEVCRASLLELDPAIFTVTGSVEQFPSVCTITTVSDVTLLGQCIGDVSTDFCDPVSFTGRQVNSGDATSWELPNATTLPATCTVGDVYVDSNGDLAQKLYLCEATDTWVQQGDISTDGRDGGQIIHGGDATASETLSLRPNTSTAPTGTLRLCDTSSMSMSTTDFICGTLVPNGFTFGDAGGSLLNLTATLTNSGGFTVSKEMRGFNYAPTLDVTNIPTLAFAGVLVGYRNAPIYQNSATGTVIGGGALGIVSAPSCQKAGSGSNFGISKMGTMEGYVGTIATGCTVTDFYAGVNAEAAGTVGGTLTNWYGTRSAAPLLGTNRAQFAAVGMSRANIGTVKSTEVWWGAESTTQERFITKNDAGHVWPTPHFCWTGNTLAVGLAADTTTRYFSVNGNRTTATTTEADHDTPVIGASQAFSLACGLSAAPNNGANTQTRTFTVMDDTGATALSCVISETATSCSDREDVTTVTLAAASMIDFRSEAANGGGSAPLATDATCTVCFTLDAW